MGGVIAGCCSHCMHFLCVWFWCGDLVLFVLYSLATVPCQVVPESTRPKSTHLGQLVPQMKQPPSRSVSVQACVSVNFFLRLLARSNFDHYARECEFGILKKKTKNKKKKQTNPKQDKKNKKIFWLCF